MGSFADEQSKKRRRGGAAIKKRETKIIKGGVERVKWEDRSLVLDASDFPC